MSTDYLQGLLVLASAIVPFVLTVALGVWLLTPPKR